ncbi:hypothetical protein F9C07_5115 [Aspergillus flavus]|uniref:Uncharacterized protein n=1 Tax=Aspergillus flavus (strain ATCC 200026 / FGSC A1120 / IAM 13836 / NRRL 3357 / JCM 12722 / SRRC 167) TaxID=332952 RepID=A0A7U2QVQ3_ASPFN|nr:hypothetical protein F9C07_5115 [Aspergillus flavus]
MMLLKKAKAKGKRVFGSPQPYTLRLIIHLETFSLTNERLWNGAQLNVDITWRTALEWYLEKAIAGYLRLLTPTSDISPGLSINHFGLFINNLVVNLLATNN